MFKPETSGAVNGATCYLPETPLQVDNLQANPQRTIGK